LACGSGRNYLAVDPQGGISSCQMARAPLANLASFSVADARQKLQADASMKYLIDPELRDGGCMSCFYKHTCAGGCPQHTARVHSTMNHVSPWCEVYGQLYPEYVHAVATHQYRRLKFVQANAQLRTT
jgi:radical SAM protein with 4Fe4S-binding SPASM domain